MNFFPNPPKQYENDNYISNFLFPGDIVQKINIIDEKIKKLEQRIARLEDEAGNSFNNLEPDNSLYMI